MSDDLDEDLNPVAETVLDPERRRLAELRDHGEPWLLWGPYLSDRQWGTVREDYSPHGTAWDYFPHDQARSRAYRWGEDGLLGICDDHGLLCFGLALWNEADPILKERFFGLTGPEGNHGEDVKEYFFYLDGTPTHSYMRALYRYPQRAFPYSQLVEENGRRGRQDPEYELIDTGVLDDNRFFDITIEYAKVSALDQLIRITCTNQGPESAPLHLLPNLWFRNTWRWGLHERYAGLSLAEPLDGQGDLHWIQATQYKLGSYWLACPPVDGRDPEFLFTENETNLQRVFGVPNETPFVKDGINVAVVEGKREAVNPAQNGTKAAAHYRLELAPGASRTIVLRFSHERTREPFAGAEALFAQRQAEADAFYAALRPAEMDDADFLVMRQAFAGLLWCKQHYRYDVARWLEGDPAMPPPPPERKLGRNHDWQTLNNNDVMSMPDSWEYPWYASWDLAFHCIPLAMIDPDFAKRQLLLLVREWFMHPNGQLPAYEWAFSDVNPPVHAWAAYRVFKIEERLTGKADRAFLERVFLKLLLNFTWWVNRKDVDGRNVFQGGFLGLDNIGVFDRTQALPGGGHLDQADGTAWMGLFCLSMLAIAVELACEDRAYEDACIKFFEHFLYIAGALNNLGGEGVSIWDPQDEFFYDVLHLPGGAEVPLKVRSLVGVIPLFAVETIEQDVLDRLPQFSTAFHWFLAHRPDLSSLVSRWEVPGEGRRRLLALVHGHRMKRVLARVLDEGEFLSDYGVRSVSRYHREHPYQLTLGGNQYSVDYEPGESTTGLFGGNSNWRGPIWFPLNYLLIESIQKYHHYYGDSFMIECPTGSGRFLTLWQVADDLSRRLTRIFLPDTQGNRPVFGGDPRFSSPLWRDNVPFYEYFHGDTGAGLGASHQTGWTALVAKLLEQTRRLSAWSADTREFALTMGRR